MKKRAKCNPPKKRRLYAEVYTAIVGHDGLRSILGGIYEILREKRVVSVAMEIPNDGGGNHVLKIHFENSITLQVQSANKGLRVQMYEEGMSDGHCRKSSKWEKMWWD